MERIICGFDGTDQAADALRMASDLATACNAKLIVAAVDEVEPLLGDVTAHRDRYFEERFDEAARFLGDVDFERRVGSGSAPGALEQIAETDHADAIVVGSTHRTSIGRVLPGSVGDRLLAGTCCAVGLAPKGYATLEHGDIKLIGVGYDGRVDAVAALEDAVDVARRTGANLKLIAVNLNEEMVAPGRGGYPREAYVEELDRYYHARVAEGMTKVPADVTASSVVLAGDPAEVLTRESQDLDLLVLGSRGYGPVLRVFLGDVAHEVVKTASCPVLIMPRSAQAATDPPQSNSTSTAVA